VCGNCAQQLSALAQAYGRNDLQNEIPRLTTTARNAAKLAHDMLGVLLEQLNDAKPKRARKATR
jgi:hypothetical protein